MKFLALLLSAAWLLCASALAQQPTQPPGVPPGSNLCNLQTGSRSVNAGVPARMFCSMDPRFGARGDAQIYWGQVSISSSSTALTVDSVNVATGNLTATLGSNLISSSGTIFASNFWRQVGKPASITGAGLNGGTLNSTVIGSVNSPATELIVSDPITTALVSSAQTITVGAYFTAADVGKSIIVPGAGSATCPIEFGGSLGTANCLITTIAGFTDSNHITLTDAATGNVSVFEQILWGTDDSTALNSLIVAAAARGDRNIYVPAKHYAPSISAQIVNFMPVGEGNLMAIGYRRHVIPVSAPAATAPQNGLRRLATTSSAGSPVFVSTGDSIWSQGTTVMPAQMPASLMGHVFRIQNPSKSPVFYDRAIGGQTWSSFDNIPSSFPSWYTNHSQQWLGDSRATGYIYALTPDLLTIGFQDNDSTSLNVNAAIDSLARIASWTKVPDVILATHWTWALSLGSIGGTDTTENQEFVAMFNRSLAEVRGYGLLDFDRQAVKLRDGYDPVAEPLVFTPVAPSGSDGTQITFPWTSNSLTTGWGGIWNESLLSPPAFFSAYGNELIFGLSRQAGNVFRIGYDNTTDSTGRIGSGNLYFQCDITALLPGAGCPGGTTPSVSTSVTIGLGSNSLTTSDPIFSVADACVWMTIPYGALGTYLVAYGNYVSTTHVNLFSDSGCTVAANATTALSSSPQPILRGNPKIQTSVNVSSDASGSTTISFAVNGTQVSAWFQDVTQNMFYRGPVVRMGGLFHPTLTSSNGSGTLFFYYQIFGFEQFNNKVGFWTEQPRFNQMSLEDYEISGYQQTPFNNTAYSSAYGGDGFSHPDSFTIQNILLPVLEAQNWFAH